MPEFPCNGPASAKIRSTSGSVQIAAEQRSSVSVTISPERDNDAGRALVEATLVEMSGNALIVEVPTNKTFGFKLRNQGLRIVVRLPLDSAVDVGTASADVMMTGRLAAASVGTASGDMRAEDVTGDVERRSASGDTEVGSVSGSLKIDTASGDLRVRTVGGDLRVKSASGDATIDAVGGSVGVSTASGDVRIGSISTGDTRVSSASGDVQVGVAQGTAVWLDVNTLSGDARSELSMTDNGAPGANPATLNLSIKTVSGDILIQRAAPVATTSSSASAFDTDD